MTQPRMPRQVAVPRGKNKMPAYENKLSAAQIKDVVAYIRQLAKGK